MNRFIPRQKWTVKIQISKQQCDRARTYGFLEHLPLVDFSKWLIDPGSIFQIQYQRIFLIQETDLLPALPLTTVVLQFSNSLYMLCGQWCLYSDCCNMMMWSLASKYVGHFPIKLSQLWFCACFMLCISCCLMSTSSIETTDGSHNPSKSYSCLASSVNKWTTVPSASHVFFQRQDL